MIGYDFKSEVARSAPTPAGGRATFAVGFIRETIDSDPIPAAAIRIVDQHGAAVAEFGMTHGTFGVLLDLQQAVIDEIHGRACREMVAGDIGL